MNLVFCQPLTNAPQTDIVPLPSGIRITLRESGGFLSVSHQKVNPSVADLRRYYIEHRLGLLTFPNGKCSIPTGIMPWQQDQLNFYVGLVGLCRLIYGWDLERPLVDPQDTVAIIAIGRAVQYPGVDRISGERRRYWIFGPKVPCVDEIPIQPADAEFLVITASGSGRDASIDPQWLPMDCQILVTGGIQVTFCSLDAAREAMSDPCGKTAAAVRDGVPLFSDVRFEELLKHHSIAPSGARHIVWCETGQHLQGTIY